MELFQKFKATKDKIKKTSEILQKSYLKKSIPPSEGFYQYFLLNY